MLNLSKSGFDRKMILTIVIMMLAWTTDDFVVVVNGDVVLSEHIMKLTLESAVLSKAVYSYPDVDDAPGVPDSLKQSVDRFDYIRNFVAEPDQALVAKKDGYCYGVFRGTTLTAEDWQDNLKLGLADICVDGASAVKNTAAAAATTTTTTKKSLKTNTRVPKKCCSARQGFHDAYYTSYMEEFEQELRRCANEVCNDCVVLTGHSQGGALAAVAGIRFSDLDPYVITFGEPPSIAPPCRVVGGAERWYRYVNTLSTTTLTTDSNVLFYDPVPFAPGFGTEVFGHFIMLGPDTDYLAYIGLNSTVLFTPPGVFAHFMTASPPANETTTVYPGYYERIKGIMDDYGGGGTDNVDNGDEKPPKPALATGLRLPNVTGVRLANVTGVLKKYRRSFPVIVQGYRPSMFCTRDEECETNRCERETTFSFPRCTGLECRSDKDCDTDRCDSGVCVPKLGSCMSCDEDSDCLAGKCYWYRCASPAAANIATAGDNNEDDDITTNDTLPPPSTKGFMDNECTCFKNEDCVSGRCEGVFGVCQAKLPIEAKCNEHSDCYSGYCDYSLRCTGMPSKTRLAIHIVAKILVLVLVLGVLLVIVHFQVQQHQRRKEYERVSDNDNNGGPTSTSNRDMMDRIKARMNQGKLRHHQQQQT